MRLLLNNVLDYDRIQSIIKDPKKIAAMYKLMSIFLGKKVTTEDTPEEKYRRYLRQRQRNEALQIHAASIQENNRQ